MIFYKLRGNHFFTFLKGFTLIYITEYTSAAESFNLLPIFYTTLTHFVNLYCGNGVLTSDIHTAKAEKDLLLLSVTVQPLFALGPL